jgi:hypothetical protein
MTKTFSIGDALVTGFALIRRRPLDVWVWGALVALPLLLSLWVVLDMIAAAPFADAAGETASAEFIASVLRTQVLSGLLNVLQLLAYVAVIAAICRAVLRPEAPRGRFFDLKVGMDEARVAVAGLAFLIGFYVAALVVALLGFAFGAALWMVSEAAAVALGIAVGLAGLVAVAWLALRACMILPASIALGDFAFAAGWSLTRGQVANLLGLAVATVAIGLVIQMLVMIVAVVVGLGFGFAFWPQLQAWSQAMEGHSALPINWPLAIGLSLLLFPFAAAFYGALTVIGTAPYASACGQLLALKTQDAAAGAELG